MCRQGTLVAIIGMVLVLGNVGGLAEPIEVKDTIESVTLYRGQALVTRLAAFEAPAGTVELVVRDLPEQIAPDSLYASAQDGIQVRAVRYRSRAIGEAPRQEVRELDERIKTVEKDIRKNQSLQKTLAERMAYVEKLGNFVAPTAQVEMTRGVLNAKTLKDLTEFMFDQHTRQADAAFELKESETELQEQLGLIRRHRADLTRTSSRVEREALVFLDKADAGAAQIRLSYLVNNATWLPAYNLRASDDMENVNVEYNALVQQMSGEDWADVALALSTASPTMSSDSPVLAPLLVSLRPAPKDPAQAGRGADLEQLKGEYSMARKNLRTAQERLETIRSREAQITRNWEINILSNEFQRLELAASGTSARILRELQRAEGSGLSVNYKLAARVSVASRSDQQILRIADLSLPAAFSNVAIPLLGEQIYRQAELANNSETALLEGRSSVYLNGDFVGSGTVPVVARGQKFVAGFGTDPQLRAWREFISKDERIQGGNREVTFKYRLVLDNYKDQATPVRAFDRVPYGQADLRVTPGEMSDPLSDEKEYLRAWRPNGILRWDIEVPAHSAAATARIVEYSFKLEYDRSMEVAIPVDSEIKAQMKAQIEQQMLAQ